jgi:hypothetical protein
MADKVKTSAGTSKTKDKLQKRLSGEEKQHVTLLERRTIVRTDANT